jgi:hypothetical protein
VDDSESRQVDLISERHVAGRYSATYIARFNGSTLPIVMTVVREVASDGEISYTKTINGLRPAWSYLKLLAGFAALGSFFNFAACLQKRRKKPSMPPPLPQQLPG